MDSEKKISPAVINRLPRYYRYLGDLLESDITRISSKELSAKMNITASQIRQDLNNFGGFGQQGYCLLYTSAPQGKDAADEKQKGRAEFQLFHKKYLQSNFL